jgi:hypothetical protein
MTGAANPTAMVATLAAHIKWDTDLTGCSMASTSAILVLGP